jgi:macrolide-specific efflux system membrane fusion protein
MRRNRLVAAGVGAVALALVAAFLLGRGGDRDEELRPVVVQLGAVEEIVEATGEVVPFKRVVISPPFSGRIEEILADEGDVVHPGDILAWMSSSDRAAILDAARAKGPGEYEHWKEAYKPTPIVAPRAGVIILNNVVAGQAVGGSTVVYALSDRLIVLAAVDESDIGRIRLGMRARINLDAYPDSMVTGRVINILYEGRNISNVITYGVKVRLDTVPPHFRSQMSANVSFVVSRNEQAVVVPEAAVRPDPRGGFFVLAAGRRGRPSPRPVKTGIETEGKVQILSGVEPGETVYMGSRKYVRQRGVQDSPLTSGKRPSSGGGGRDRSGPSQRR